MHHYPPTEELIKEAERMKNERDSMQTELDELKTVAVMTETTYREEMEEVRETWKAEVCTMQAILRGRQDLGITPTPLPPPSRIWLVCLRASREKCLSLLARSRTEPN